jgi:hypothetical protein
MGNTWPEFPWSGVHMDLSVLVTREFSRSAELSAHCFPMTYNLPALRHLCMQSLLEPSAAAINYAWDLDLPTSKKPFLTVIWQS